MITGLYPAPPRLPPLGRDARPRAADAVHRRLRARVHDGQLRLRRELPLQGLPGRERRGHERDARRRGRVAAGAPLGAVRALVPQLGDAHAVRHPPRRAQGVARGEGRDHRGDPVGRRCGARGAARGLRALGRALVRDVPRRLPRGARLPRAARGDGARVHVRPRRVVGRAVRRQGGGEGHVPHARRDGVRRDRRGAADRLGPGTRPARRRALAGQPRRPHPDASRPGRCAAPRRRRRRLARARAPRRGDGRPGRLDRRHGRRPGVAGRAAPSRRGN